MKHNGNTLFFLDNKFFDNNKIYKNTIIMKLYEKVQ